MGCNIMRPEYIAKQAHLWMCMPYNKIQIALIFGDVDAERAYPLMTFCRKFFVSLLPYIQFSFLVFHLFPIAA
jgi:hypothetical protein